MNNFSKRLAGLSLGLLLTLGVGAAGGQHDVVGVKAEDSTATFDLTTKTQITEATSSSLAFTSGSQVFSIAKNNASSGANNYCPASETARTETRAYNGSLITVDAGAGNIVKSAVFTYSDPVSFTGDTWTNATYDSETGTATASGSFQTISVLCTGTRKMKKVVLTYAENPNPSISLNKIDELNIGNTGTFTYTTSKATESSIVVAWSSSNTNVLSFDDDGKYTCKASGTTTITANMTCTEGTASASVNVTVNTGLIAIEQANQIGSTLSSGSTTEFSVTIKGYITNLNADDQKSGSERMITLSDKKSGESDANSLNIFGIYSNSDLRDIALLDAQVTMKGKLNNYNGALQLKGPEWSNFSIDAAVFASHFVSTLNEDACKDPTKDNTEALKTAWTDLKAKWAYVDATSKETLQTATAEDETYGAFVKLYDHIMNRYGEDKLGTGANFVGRTISSTTSGAHVTLASADNSLTITIIVLVSVLSVSLIVGTSLIVRKRKAN